MAWCRLPEARRGWCWGLFRPSEGGGVVPYAPNGTATSRVLLFDKLWTTVTWTPASMFQTLQCHLLLENVSPHQGPIVEGVSRLIGGHPGLRFRLAEYYEDSSVPCTNSYRQPVLLIRLSCTRLSNTDR